MPIPADISEVKAAYARDAETVRRQYLWQTTGNPTHALASVSPASQVSGGGTFLLTATGTGFVNTDRITWDGVPVTTTYVGATSLTATVPKKATAGTITVDVINEAGKPAPVARTATFT